jgi:hypothetical protein
MIIEKNKAGKIIRGISERDPERHLNPICYIGIDPDIDKSGFAFYSKPRKMLMECISLDYFELTQKLEHYDTYMKNYIVHLEGGWLNRSNNWHSKPGDNWAKRQRISKNVGANHQAGLQIMKLLIHMDIPFIVVKPLKPIFDDENLFKKITGWHGRTNKDARSAARYVYGF